MDNTIKTSLKIVRFKHLSACSDVCHGIFSRIGGCSKTPFDSLNVGISTGDEEKNVLKNRHIITKVFGGGSPVFINQVHGKKVLVLKKNKNSLRQDSQESSYIAGQVDRASPSVISHHPPPSADGIVTDITGVLLFIQVADCQPVMLYDPVNKVIANIHSGWRGSLQNIVGAGVDTMKREFGSDPAFLLAGIGPSLGPCCSEFLNYESEIPENFLIYKQGKNYFDFWQMTIDQLMEKGLRSKNIELSRICTKCSHKSFFSYRYKKTTGRFASVIGMV